MEPVRLSQEYLSAIRDREDTTEQREELREIDLAELASDDVLKAFWINLYNASAQELVDAHPVLFRTRLLYMLPLVHVSGNRISLNTIHHGFLRRSRLSFGRGYLGRPFTTSLEHRMRLDDPDPRINLALNTGTLGSPEIRFYSASHIDQELDTITERFLDDRVVHDRNSGIVRVPHRMHRFSGDFGGATGILDFLKDHDIIPDHARPAIRYRSPDRRKATRRFT